MVLRNLMVVAVVEMRLVEGCRNPNRSLHPEAAEEVVHPSVVVQKNSLVAAQIDLSLLECRIVAIIEHSLPMGGL